MGSGYRVFTAGEVLTASNVQNYLQDQAVMVFGGTAARSSAIGTANFEEGMLTYLTDVDKLQVYTGAAFADVYPPTASSQGLTLLSTVAFSGVTSVSLPANTFTSTYSNYRFVINVTTVSGDLSLQFRLRAAGADNTTNNYYMRGIESIFGSNPNLANDGTISTLFGIDNGTNAMLTGDIIAPQESTRTSLIGNGVGVRTDGNNAAWFVSSWFNATTSFDSASFIASANNMTGVISVYGYNK